MDLGKNIAKARKNANLTQEQLAELMAVTRQTVSPARSRAQMSSPFSRRLCS